jgi:hypothetical protein
LVDVATGTATEFLHNGTGVACLSFSDDGRYLAFKGFDPTDSSWGFYRANADGSEAVKFFDVTELGATPGVISGDGTKLLFIDRVPFPPFTSNVFLVEIDSGDVVRLNQRPLNDIVGASMSFDGARIVYSTNPGPIFGVNADGTGHHRIADPLSGIPTTLTRDGTYVLYFCFTGTFQTCRVRWDGSELVGIDALGALAGGFSMSHIPVNSTGSVVGSGSSTFGVQTPLVVWFEDSPILTTYGFGNPGTVLTWDVGGSPEDTYILAFALNQLNPGAGTQFGLLGLDPASLSILATGTVMPRSNVGRLQIDIPALLDLPSPLEIHFQALVQGPSGEGKLTNRTTMVLQNADSSSASVSGPSYEWMSLSQPQAQPFGSPVSASITPEQRMRQIMLEDASLWSRIEPIDHH